MTPRYLSVPEAADQMMKVHEMALEAGVSDEKVRQWCKSGKIAGVIDVGDEKRRFLRAPRWAWDEFKAKRALPMELSKPARNRAGTNLLGI